MLNSSLYLGLSINPSIPGTVTVRQDWYANANLAPYLLSYQEARVDHPHPVNSLLRCDQGLILNTGQKGLYRLINHHYFFSPVCYCFTRELFCWSTTPPDPIRVEPVTPYLLLLEAAFLPASVMDTQGP